MFKARKYRHALLLAVLVISSIVLAGCASGELPAVSGTAAPSTPSGYQQVLSNSLLVLKNASTYKFDFDINMNLEIKGGTTAGKLNIGTTMNGTLNQSANEAQMDLGMTMKSDQKDIAPGTQTVALQVYLLSGTLYLGMDIPSTGHQWFKAAYSENLAKIYSLDEVDTQLAPLASNVTNLKYVKDEILDGVNCYVLNMTPNMAEIIPLVAQELPANVNADQIARIFKQLSYTVWIARDSGQLKNLQGTMELQINANQFMSDGGLDLSAANMNVTLTMKIYDYNVPVTIKLPPDAQNVMELPGLATK